MIDVTCQQCGAVYHSDKTHIGKHLRCSRCACLVPISTDAERAVVQQSPAFPDATSQASTSSAKHPTRRVRRVYLFAIATTLVALVAVLLFLLWRPTATKQRTAMLSNIDKPAQSQQNQNADNTIDFRPDASLATSPEASAQPPELQYNASDKSQPSTGQRHAQ